MNKYIPNFLNNKCQNVHDIIKNHPSCQKLGKSQFELEKKIKGRQHPDESDIGIT